MKVVSIPHPIGSSLQVFVDIKTFDLHLTIPAFSRHGKGNGTLPEIRPVRKKE